MKKLYKFVGGQFNGQTRTETEAQSIWPLYGCGLSKDWSKERSEGACVPSELLDREYLFEGYLDPMIDGYIVGGSIYSEEPTEYDGIVLRYETQEVYDMLSR